MTTTAPPQTTLTRAQIEAAIAALQPVQRVMVRLLLLPYLDPTPEDIAFMARERSEPNMRAGLKQGGRSQVAHDKISGLQGLDRRGREQSPAVPSPAARAAHPLESPGRFPHGLPCRPATGNHVNGAVAH